MPLWLEMLWCGVFCLPVDSSSRKNTVKTKPKHNLHSFPKCHTTSHDGFAWKQNGNMFLNMHASQKQARTSFIFTYVHAVAIYHDNTSCWLDDLLPSLSRYTQIFTAVRPNLLSLEGSVFAISLRLEEEVEGKWVQFTPCNVIVDMHTHNFMCVCVGGFYLCVGTEIYRINQFTLLF